MLNNVKLVLDKSCRKSRLESFWATRDLASHLSRFALNFSILSDFLLGWTELRQAFEQANMVGWDVITPKELKGFYRASRQAYRMLIVIRDAVYPGDESMPCPRPLLSIKFYGKEDKKEFYEWRFSIGSNGRIYNFGAFGTGELGRQVMDNRRAA